MTTLERTALLGCVVVLTIVIICDIENLRRQKAFNAVVAEDLHVQNQLSHFLVEGKCDAHVQNK